MLFTDPRPTLRTARLLLRPFVLDDADRVRQLAGHPLVAATTALIPHPYPAGAAEAFIETHAGLWRDRGHAVFAVCTADDGLVGAMDVVSEPEQGRASLGYWIGVPYWGRGFCSEAGRAAVGFAFDVLGVRKVYATHMASNPASGAVMKNLGMVREGVLRAHGLKNGQPYDLVYYGRLRTDP